MTEDPESDEVCRLLARLEQHQRPTDDERARIRAAVAVAVAGERREPGVRTDRSVPASDLEVVELVVADGVGPDGLGGAGSRRRRRLWSPVLAAASVLALAALAALVVGATRSSPPPADEPRVDVELGDAAVSFAFTEPATLDELADDVISYRATEFISPFGASSSSRLGAVTVARPAEVFDGLEPEVFFAANGLEHYLAPAIVEGARVPAWNVTIPAAERDRRGCDPTGPCVVFGELASGGTLAMEAGLLSRIVLVPLDAGGELIIHMHHVGPPQGSSQDAVSRLRDEIVASLTVG